MPTIPNWYEQADAWDAVIIQGFPLPGLSHATATTGRKIDVRSVRGKDGARIRDGGYQPAKVEVECIVWDTNDLQVLSEAIEAIQPRGGTARSPIQIQHPALAAIGISQVYVESIQAPKLERGKLITKFTFLEWTEQPRTTRRGTTDDTAPPVSAEPTAFDQHEQQTASRNRPPAQPPGSLIAAGRLSGGGQ